MKQRPNLHSVYCYPPWQCHGQAYILNYWASPQLLEQSKAYNLRPSRAGHMLHVILIRYTQTPIGAYDALFIVDHPVRKKQRYSTIAKIFVSNEASMLHGQNLWGLPKQLAKFTWTETNTATYCQVEVNGKNMKIQLNRHKNSPEFYINSHQLPHHILNVQQHWQSQDYTFTPQFRGKLHKLKSVQWHDSEEVFPDFNQARYINSFYMSEVQLLLPEAKIEVKTPVSRETT